MTQRKHEINLDEQIEVNLRRVFQEKVEEAVPDKFMQLLQQLKDQDEQHGKS
jgi:hypothetical protein